MTQKLPIARKRSNGSYDVYFIYYADLQMDPGELIDVCGYSEMLFKYGAPTEYYQRGGIDWAVLEVVEV